MKGTVSEDALPLLLRDLYVGRKTGRLDFQQGEAVRSMIFFRGQIVHALSSVQEEHLGELLVRDGVITQQGLERATEKVVSDRKRRLGAVLVEMELLDQAHLEDAVAVHVREVLGRVLRSSGGSYSFEERDAAMPPDEDISRTISTGDLILETVRQIRDPEAVRAALGDVNRLLVPSSDPLLRFQRIFLTPTDGYLLSRVDGTVTAQELSQLIPVATEETERSLLALVSTGIVEFQPPRPKRTGPRQRPAPPTHRVEAAPGPPPSPAAAPSRPASSPPPAASSEASAPPRSSPPPATPGRPGAAAGGAASGAAAQAATAPGPSTDGASAEARRQEITDLFAALKRRNHFEILGVPRRSNEAQVKDAYFRLARKFHPDTQRDPRLRDLKDQMEAIFIRVGEAYEVLRDPRQRAEYENRLGREPAQASGDPAPSTGPSAPAPAPSTAPDPELVAREAEDAVRRAEAHFKQEQYWDAIRLLEAQASKAEGRWRRRGRLMLAKCYLKNPNWVKRGEEELLALIKEDAKDAEAYFALGNLYKERGLRSRAVSMFRKVVELKPDHEAAASLKALAPEPVPEAPSTDSGLLRRLFGKS